MNVLDKYVLPYLKAHAAGFGAGFSMILNDANGDLTRIGHLTGSQWTAALVATGLLGGLVAAIPNTAKEEVFDPASAGAADAQDTVGEDAAAQDASA